MERLWHHNRLVSRGWPDPNTLRRWGVAPGEKLLGHSVCARFAAARRLAHSDFRLPLARPLEVL